MAEYVTCRHCSNGRCANDGGYACPKCTNLPVKLPRLLDGMPRDARCEFCGGRTRVTVEDDARWAQEADRPPSQGGYV